MPDALRATAILLVVTAHVVPDMSFLTAIVPINTALGSWAVDAFFVLSGFLLGRPYIDSLLGRRPMPSAALYARRRFLRIWPAYAVVVVASAAMTVVHHGHNPSSLRDIGAHLLMLHNLSTAFVDGVGNMPLWTMAVDAQFYVALPIVAWLTMRAVARFSLPKVRTILVLIVASIAISLAWRVFAISHFPESQQDVHVFQRGVVGMGLCFAMGGLIALAQALSIAVSQRLAIALVAIGTTLAAMIFSAPLWWPAPWSSQLPTFLDILGALSVPAILLGGTNLRCAGLTGFIGSPAVAAVAANAYCLYLVHTPLKYALLVTLERYHVHVGTLRFSLALLVMYAVTASLVAFLLHHFIEQPFLTMKERARETLVT